MKLPSGNNEMKFLGHGNGNKFHRSRLKGEILPLATMIGEWRVMLK